MKASSLLFFLDQKTVAEIIFNSIHLSEDDLSIDEKKIFD